MYLKFYGLREEPFGVTPDPRFLCASPTYLEAQATLEYGIRSGRGFTALIAKPGMGKTTLLFHLLERYSKVARTAFIFLTQCDSREFMRYLMSELGTDTGETDFVRLQEQFGQLLVREAQAGKKVIAVVDEAQNLDVSVLETVRLLSDFETPRAKLLHIILTGQPELADRLASPALLQLRQRISHLVRLEPLSASDVNRYIDHRLRVAGYAGASLFTLEARALIAQRSEGIPRTINNLCFNALSLGCALQRRNIGADILAEVSADLDFEGLSVQQQEAAEAAKTPPAPSPQPASIPSTPQAAGPPATPRRQKPAGSRQTAIVSRPQAAPRVSAPPAAAPTPPPAVVSPQAMAVPSSQPAVTASSQTAEAPGPQPTEVVNPQAVSVPNSQPGPAAVSVGEEAAGAEQAPSQPATEVENGSAGQVAPPPASEVPANAGEAEEVPATAAREITAETPAAPAPGPVLVPDSSPGRVPNPVQVPAVACQTSEVASAEVGNLALRIVPAEVAPEAAVVPVPMNGTNQADAAAADFTTAPAPTPVNGTGTPAAAEKAESSVDVDALAADCALFGMEEPKRWQRPVGKIPIPTASSGAAARSSVPTAAAPRANGPRPVVTQLPSPGTAAPARPGPANGSTKTTTRIPQVPTRVPGPVAATKLWPPRPAAAMYGRKRRRQRSVYLAAGASLLLLFLLIWLLGTSGPATSSPPADAAAPAQSVSSQPDASSNDGTAASASDSSVLDVVEELPRPGESADSNDTRPAVVMRGTRAGEELLHRVDPVYPAAARANRIQGPVVLEATIGTHGFLRHIRVVSGDPLLADSVLDAVRGWRYRPRTVRGRAVETETRIVVNFQLANSPRNSQQNP
ncbi:MAG TPA: TonB family protein [Terriglobales bacterium]|nr:TonB family protein [Terriglobales bacterium]